MTPEKQTEELSKNKILNLHVIHYNIKLLLRSKFLIIYFLFTYGIIIYAQIRNQSNIFYSSSLDELNFSSFIPYMNTFLFSIFLTLPLIVFGSYFLYKERKIDTLETIYYRPISNTKYIQGICFAFICVFGGVATLLLLLTMFTHVFTSSAPFNILHYLFYLLTLLVPTIIFILGLSFFMVTWIKNHILSIIILLGYVFFTVFYITDYQSGLLDPFGITLPNTFSDITGHPNITNYLLQRGCWLFLGLGLIQLTVLNFPRLPNHPSKKQRLYITVTLITIGLLSGITFFISNQCSLSLRHTYSDIYNKFTSAPKATLLSQNIKYEQTHKKMSVNSELLVQNLSGKILDEIILYLNPGLKITSLTSNGIPLPYERKQQVIIIKNQLLVNDSIEFQISYEGRVDENLCYLDIPDKAITNTSDKMYLASRHGKHYAYQEKNFTLLTPEVSWYPTTEPPVNPHSPHETPKNFTNYTLQVSPTGKNKAISQGKKSFNSKYTVFKNEYPLTGISLCIGDYITRRITVDSITYELNIFNKHAHLFKNFGKHKDFSLVDLIRQVKHVAEVTTGKNYPYKRFILTETPVNFTSYFRNAQGGSEFVQPELVFYPERGFGTPISPSKKTTDEQSSSIQNFLLKENNIQHSFSWENILALYSRKKKLLYPDSFEYSKNLHLIFPLFINQMTYLYSSEYPCINTIVNITLIDNNATNTDGRKHILPRTEFQAIEYLSGKSLKEALQDEHIESPVLDAILVLKNRELVDILNTRGIPQDSLISFLNTFITRYQFQKVNFQLLNEEFKAKHHIDWEEIIPIWYNCNQIPTYFIQNTYYTIIKTTDGRHRSNVKFSIFNNSNVDGIINIESKTLPPGGLTALRQALDEKKRAHLIKYQAIEIKANTGKEFSFMVDNLRAISLNTNISGNIPNRIQINSTPNAFSSDTTQYTRDLTKEHFLTTPDETIVDNTDPGFKTTQYSGKLRAHLKNDIHTWEKYENFKSQWITTSPDTWKQYIHQEAYGFPIRSYMYKKVKSSNKSAAEWKTNLDREGMFEILVYIPENYIPANNRLKSYIQKYGIFFHDKQEELSYINMNQNQGWHSLGSFYCTPGEHKIFLYDEGDEEQILIADAIKWVYKNTK